MEQTTSTPDPVPAAPPTGVHQIKRYVNRKLYSLSLARYVTLEDVQGFVKAGDVVRVLSGLADVTDHTLALTLATQIAKCGTNPTVHNALLDALVSL